MILPHILFRHHFCDFPEAQLSHVVGAERDDVVVIKAEPKGEPVEVISVTFLDFINSADGEKMLLNGVEANN